MSKQDDGGKLCKSCGPVTRASIQSLSSDAHVENTRMIPLPEDSQVKFEEALGLVPGEWSIATEVLYSKQKWTFNLILRNNLDSAQNARIFGCTFG